MEHYEALLYLLRMLAFIAVCLIVVFSLLSLIGEGIVYLLVTQTVLSREVLVNEQLERAYEALRDWCREHERLAPLQHERGKALCDELEGCYYACLRINPRFDTDESLLIKIQQLVYQNTQLTPDKVGKELYDE
jgi:hypothetical protein